MSNTTYPYIPIFWSGTHKNKGSKKEWSADDVKLIFENTKKLEDKKIPFTIDHPENDLPVIGWTDMDNLKLTFQGDKAIIEAKPTIFSEDILKQVKESGRKKVSIALKGDDYSIRHIGLVEKPAVTDLPQIPFSQAESEDIIFTLDTDMPVFMDWTEAMLYETSGRLFQSLRDWFIEQKGVDVADKIVSQWDIDQLKSASQFIEMEDNKNNFSEGGQKMADQNIPTEFQAELDSKSEEIARLKAELETARKEKQLLEFSEYLNQDAIKTRVVPAVRPKALRLMQSLDTVQAYEFTEEGSEAPVSVTPLQEFKEFIEALPEAVQFGINPPPAQEPEDNLAEKAIEQVNKTRK